MSEGEMTLGRYLDAARNEAGLSLRLLADAVDVQPTIIVRLLSDQVQRPKSEVLIRLAEVLELRATDLFLLAGVPMTSDLPSVEVLLRAEYDLPEDAVAEAKEQIEAIVARYHRPTNREEETHGTN